MTTACSNRQSIILPSKLFRPDGIRRGDFIRFNRNFLLNLFLGCAIIRYIYLEDCPLNQSYATRPSVGKIVVATILAVVLGLLNSFLLTFQLMLPMPALSLVSVVIVALYASAGVIPAIALAVVALGSAVLTFGLPMTAIMIPMCALPPVMMILGIRAKRPFFQQVRRGLVVCIGGTAVSVLLMGVLFGGDIIGQLMDFIRQIFEESKTILWESMAQNLQAMGLSLTLEEFSSAYLETLSILQTYYEYHMLSNLLSGAVLTGVLAVFWGNWLAARRGEATADSFLGLHEWYLPANLTWGLLLTLVFAAILRALPVSGSATLQVIVGDLAQLAFMIQAFAAMDRKLKTRGASRGRRTGMVILILIAGMLFGYLYTIAALAGCASALFGRKGAARPAIEKIKSYMDGGDR